ncbi:unnamed protein product [Linum tenue]|uniref:Uncharacterized protein n=1 Tax=Linum tenue TaxID=586396 RepID=A0AAV0KSI6_9ROSI|nr:unnamed protein product [Linum tenue]
MAAKEERKDSRLPSALSATGTEKGRGDGFERGEKSCRRHPLTSPAAKITANKRNIFGERKRGVPRRRR